MRVVVAIRDAGTQRFSRGNTGSLPKEEPFLRATFHSTDVCGSLDEVKLRVNRLQPFSDHA